VDAPVKLAATTPDGNNWAPLALTLDGMSVETLKALRDANDLRILQPVNSEKTVDD